MCDARTGAEMFAPGTSQLRARVRLRAFPIYGVAGAAVLLDWACASTTSDSMRTERASAGTAQQLLRLTVRVVVTMKSCLSASKVGSLVGVGVSYV